MSISLRQLRARVNMRLRNTDSKRLTYTTPEVDTALCDAYIALQAHLPGLELYTASAFTISSGASTFALPATVSQWTGNDGGAEYNAIMDIQLASTGWFLKKLRWDELMTHRNAFPTLPTGEPRVYALTEDRTQGVTGYLDRIADKAYACNLTVRLSADDLRDFVGSGTDDLDDVEVQLSRIAAQALVLEAAADLLERMTPEDLRARRLSGKSVASWRKAASDLAYKDAGRRHDVNDVGRQMRWVS